MFYPLIIIDVYKQGRKWHQGAELYGKTWSTGDIVGVMLDLHDKTISTSNLFSSIIWKNESFRNRENHSRLSLLSLFMRTNGKCNNSHAPSIEVVFCFLSEPNIPEGPESP